MRKREGLSALTRTLNSLSYLRVLDRGFAVVRGEDGKIIADAATIASGDALSIEFKERKTIAATAGEGAPAPAPKKRKAKAAPKPKATPPEQTDLFGD